MIKKLLKLSYAIVAVGLLFVQYASATPTDDDLNVLSRFEYLFRAPLEPQLSSDGKTLYNAVLPVVFVADPNPSREPVRIPAPFDLLNPPESAPTTFSITYVPEDDTDLWGKPCQTFPDDAKAAFDAAANIWGNIIQSSVPITINACWANLGSGDILGYSGGGPLVIDFPNAPDANAWYVGSLANALAGYDLDPNYFDMHITYNLNFSWYYGTDGKTPSDKFDLMTVVLHEIAHGLNFSGSMSYSYLAGTGSWGYGSGYPNIYDTFMKDDSGNQLINTGVYGNPSTLLGTALTSNNIYFHGSNAMAANGGQRVRMFAPSTWMPGSSYSHLDYFTFNGTANRLMVYAVSEGDSIHDPGPLIKGLLKDLGWPWPCPTPGMPSNPSPSHEATVVSTSLTLNWSACANTDSYDVYLGTSSNPPYVGNTTSASYPLSGLSTNITYYWKIVAKNSCGGSTTGAVWRFTTLHKWDEIMGTGGTWSSGIWYYNLATKTWSKPFGYTPSGPIAVGDVTGDGKADMVSVWPSGLWYQDGATLAWTNVSSVAPSQVAVGDITGDGRAEIIGTWGSGIWYWNPATSGWTKMTSYVPTGPIAAGDVTGDGRADVVSCWPSGLWYQNGATLVWTQVYSVAPSQVAVGDITGDGWAEIIGTWGSGIWYWNVHYPDWTQMYAGVPSGPIAAGDVTGDGRADVVSVWPSGLWYQGGATLNWTKVHEKPPGKIAVGDIIGN